MAEWPTAVQVGDTHFPAETHRNHGLQRLSPSVNRTAVIFDRDYKSDIEIEKIESNMAKKAVFAHIHRRKEIENYLLERAPLTKAIKAKIADQNARTGNNQEFKEDIDDILRNLTDPMKHNVGAQYQTKKVEYARRTNPGLDRATITASVMKEFDEVWSDLQRRLTIVPGKDVLARLNESCLSG